MTTVKMVKLGTLIKPAKLQKCGNEDYPVLSMTMHNGLVFQSDKFKKSVASQDKSTYKVVHRNQLVVGFPIDEGVLATQRITDVGIVSPAYGIWDVDQTKIIPEFLEYALRCNRAIDYYKAKLRGSTARRRSLPTPTLLELDVPLPDIEQQKLALTTIHHAKNALDSRQAQLTKLDELIKARFVEMFGDPKLNPYRFPCNSLSTYITFLTSGSRGWSQYFTDSGEYFITIKNVKNCKITLQDVQYVAPPDNAEAKRTKVQKNDLLISITADLGRTGVVTEEIANHGAYINQHLTCIRLKDEQVNPLYVAYYMESDAGKEQFTAKNQSAVKAGLNFNAINSLKLMAPPLSLQNQFAAFVAEVDKSKLFAELFAQSTCILAKIVQNRSREV